MSFQTADTVLPASIPTADTESAQSLIASAVDDIYWYVENGVGKKHHAWVFRGLFCFVFNQIVIVGSFAISELFKALSLPLFPLDFKLTNYQMFVLLLIGHTKTTHKQATPLHAESFFNDFKGSSLFSSGKKVCWLVCLLL